MAISAWQSWSSKDDMHKKLGLVSGFFVQIAESAQLLLSLHRTYKSWCKMKKIFAAAMLLLMMTACCGTKGPALEGTTWKLLEMNGQRDAALFNAVADDFTFTLDPAELRISGKTNCNRFFGVARSILRVWA
ncbi:MAG: hypothetical protein RR574_19140 [Comamonas sp.]